MRVSFYFNLRDNGDVVITSQDQKYFIAGVEYSNEPLHLLFNSLGAENLPFYRDLLNEIDLIEKSKNEVFEDSYDVGGGLSFELKITKEITICETWAAERKVLELLTPEFKELVENWIKFVEVNTAAFGNK